MGSYPLLQALDRGMQHHQAGQFAEAEAIYRQVLAEQPDNAEALHLLGLLAYQVGQPDIAVDLIGRAISVDPTPAAYHSNLGLALTSLGQTERAIASLKQAIRIDPQLPDAYCNLASACYLAGQLNDAISAAQRAIQLRPAYPEAINNLANALAGQQRTAEAIAAYRQALQLRPDLSEAHSNLGKLLRDQGQLEQAIESFREAIRLNPHLGNAYVHLGDALRERRQTHEAIDALRTAISLLPGLAEAQNSLGNALRDAGRLDDAIAAFRTAIQLKPGYADAMNNLGNAQKDQGRIEDAIETFRAAIQLNPGSAVAHSNLLYTLHFDAASDPESLYREHQIWNQRFAAPLKHSIQPHANDRSADRRLRIGYVSADLNEHPVGRFLLPLLQHRDRDAFEVFCYADVPLPDGNTDRLRGLADAWRDLRGLSDEQAARLIREDRIDVLIELGAHTARNRLLTLARKPAPVLATYLAYPSTTGMDTIDYRLSDAHLDPDAVDERFYSERTVRLPGTYWCYGPPEGAPDVGALPAASSGIITFGCLNNFAKVSTSALSAWCRILAGVDDSRLILHAYEGTHRQRVMQVLSTNGIDPSRLRFVGAMSMREHLAIYNSIDIALDPFPYNGGTTTCDALWMGVPVVSLVGRTSVGRAGSSLLHHLGRAELLAQTERDYIDRSVNLARDIAGLASIRASLRPQMQRSPLTDGPRFTREFHHALRVMWRAWCQP